MQQLDEQVAVITGGARGIGLGIATVLAQAGARVVLADLDLDAARSAATSLGSAGLAAEAHPVDVTDRPSVDALAAQVLAAHGRIDILAANAGIYPSTELASIDDAIWDRVMDINVKGALHAVQACLPPMLARGYGRIVMSSSITGPITGQAGLRALRRVEGRDARPDALGRGRGRDARHHGATPSCPATSRRRASPTRARSTARACSPRSRWGASGRRADVGFAVRYLASPEAGYMTGQTLVIDGGQVLPEGMDT